MDGFQRRKESKKKEILKASLSLFMAYGVQKVSIGEIAKKAAVSQVTIYNYFESKDKLVYETMVYYVDLAWEESNKVLRSDLSFEEKVKQLIFNKKEAAEKIHEDFYLFFMKEYEHGNSFIEEFYQKKAIPAFTAFFEEGKKRGEVNPNVSTEAILFYIHMIKEYTQREDVYSKILPLTEEIMSLLFYGISSNKASR